jgi:hypothetical protein
MFGFAVRSIIAITVGMLFLLVVVMALVTDLVTAEASPRRQKPTQRARNRVQWVRS